MKIKIQLPTDKEEAVFILELLKRLNINFELEEDDIDSIALMALLKVRIKDMDMNPDDIISWGNIKEGSK